MDIALSAQTNPGRLQSASLKVNQLRVQSKSIIVAAEVCWVRKVEKVEDGRRIGGCDKVVIQTTPAPLPPLRPPTYSPPPPAPTAGSLLTPQPLL